MNIHPHIVIRQWSWLTRLQIQRGQRYTLTWTSVWAWQSPFVALEGVEPEKWRRSCKPRKIVWNLRKSSSWSAVVDAKWHVNVKLTWDADFAHITDPIVVGSGGMGEGLYTTSSRVVHFSIFTENLFVMSFQSMPKAMNPKLGCRKRVFNRISLKFTWAVYFSMISGANFWRPFWAQIFVPTSNFPPRQI